MSTGVIADYISGDSGINEIAQNLKEYLIAMDPDAHNDVNIRVHSSVTSIDTTDLSDWYVYDHYDDGFGTSGSGVAAYQIGYTASGESESDAVISDRLEYAGCRPHHTFVLFFASSLLYILHSVLFTPP